VIRAHVTHLSNLLAIASHVLGDSHTELLQRATVLVNDKKPPLATVNQVANELRTAILAVSATHPEALEAGSVRVQATH
jgi:hypothetical protein